MHVDAPEMNRRDSTSESRLKVADLQAGMRSTRLYIRAQRSR